MSGIPPYRVDMLRGRLCRLTERYRIPTRHMAFLDAIGVEHGDRYLVWRRGWCADRPLDGIADFELADSRGRQWSFRKVERIGVAS